MIGPKTSIEGWEPRSGSGVSVSWMIGGQAEEWHLILVGPLLDLSYRTCDQINIISDIVSRQIQVLQISDGPRRSLPFCKEIRFLYVLWVPAINNMASNPGAFKSGHRFEEPPG